LESKKPINFLTFDIEEMYHANYGNINFEQYNGQPTQLDSLVDRLIALCETYNIKSTCFVLGSVAFKKPGIVKKLHRAGHEIASHGFGHTLVYQMSRESFQKDLKRSCDVLEDCIGEKVWGFRAPSWSVNEQIVSWFYDTLNDQGLKYSSSVYPAHTFLYGIPGFPLHAHYPRWKGYQSPIIEIPVPVFSIFGKKMGYSGGFYLRMLPLWFIQNQIIKHNKSSVPVFVYLHPREIDKEQPHLPLPILERIIHYWGINSCECKLKHLIQLNTKTFIRMKDCYFQNK
jgi:polysaccharide deacetylase family protein (PEP-CTERM system associated)